MMRHYSFSQSTSLFLFMINLVALVGYFFVDYSTDGVFDMSTNWGGIALSAMFGIACLWYALKDNAARYTT